ncbi:E-selectin-like [Dendropsophus ebraccatus]|uniref:E-selectin-like n=1 Tax=Dendropsophus ebraccatus TaxID=150705 RepID=UPI00383186D9
MNLEKRSPPYGGVCRKGRILGFLLLCNGTFMLSTVHCWTYHYSTQSLPYEQARSYCQSNYTDLVAIQNKREIEYLVENIPKNPSYYWIGIRKINDTWTWVGTNKTLTEEATNWGKGEPNNKGNKEDCVEIYIKRHIDSGKWNDDACRKKKRALCYTASCHQLSCGTHGECIETINNYTCDCYPGFYGPQCQYVVQCQDLSAPSQGYMNCSHPWGNFSFQSSCQYGCFDGFVLDGAHKSICLPSGTWSSAEPYCTAVTCEALRPPHHGSITCHHPLDENGFSSTCEVSCLEGWTLKGFNKTMCGPTGQWTEEIPECEAVTCNALSPPQQGSITCHHPQAENGFGSTCEFTCLEGWKVKGSNKTVCGPTGQWVEDIPECEAQESVVDHQEDHTTAVYITGLATATSALFLGTLFWLVVQRLKRDKKKNKISQLECCVKRVIIIMLSLAIAVYTQNSIVKNRLGFLSQDPVTFQVVGSKFVGNLTSLRLLCLAAVGFGFLKFVEVSGWTYHYSTALLSWNEAYDWCKENYTNMAAIQNKEEISYLVDYLPGNDGHYWIGLRKVNNIWVWIGTNKSLTKHEEHWAHQEPNNRRKNQDCVEIYIKRINESGKWNDEPCHRKKRALCYLVSCNDSSCNNHGDCIETIQNYTCNCWPGFYGANCANAVSCRPLQSPSHGVYICSDTLGSFQYNSICNFSCEEGFELSGTRSLFCQSSGNWSDSTPTCEAISCSALENPSHGRMNCSYVFGDYRLKSICEFTCDEGFQMKGSDTLLCEHSGEWSEPMPKCIAVPCVALQSPEHGTVNCSDAFGEFSYRSVCNVTCKEGFELLGTSSLSCQDTGDWSGSVPTCIAVNVPPEPPKQAYTAAYALTTSGLILSGISVAYGIHHYRKKKNPGLLKTDKDNINTFENPVFQVTTEDVY